MLTSATSTNAQNQTGFGIPSKPCLCPRHTPGADQVFIATKTVPTVCHDHSMVGVSNTADPVGWAHKAIHAPGASVQQVLSSLAQPPLAAIPHIDDPTAQPGHWVRYTAMVQDIWDTELFVASSPERKSGLLMENAAASDNPAAVLAERLPVYLVSLPGETAWVRAHRAGNISVPAGQHPASASSGPQTSGVKRSRDEDHEMTDDPAASISANPNTSIETPQVRVVSESADKRSRSNTMQNGTPQHCVGLNLPVHNQPAASAVIAKLYDSAKGRELKINTMVEVAGILQDALALEQVVAEPDAFTAEFAARNPNNVQRLHVVSWRELSALEVHPLTARLGAAGVEAARKEVKTVAAAMRDVLVKYFASALLGDLLAAEYLVMCLLSRPVRTAGGGILGKLSLNIVLPSDASTSATADIIQAVHNVFASVVVVNVSIAGLNSVELLPRKDYGMNRLKAGALQVASGTCLIGNESGLSDGCLAERGVKNVRALTSVSQRCVSPVDFEYYEAEVGVDCCTMLISKGGKSIIPTDVVIRVKRDNELQLRGWDTYEADILRKMRLALILLAEDGKFDINEEAGKEVEQAYVDARRKGQAKDGQESLQLWLSVARCCARCYGEGVLTAELWRHALDMERRRLERTKR